MFSVPSYENKSAPQKKSVKFCGWVEIVGQKIIDTDLKKHASTINKTTKKLSLKDPEQ